MRYPVHKKVNHAAEKSKVWKILGSVVQLWIALPMLLAFCIFMIADKIWLGLLMLLLGICSEAGLYWLMTIPETSGYLELGEEIIFHNMFGKLKHKRYQYRDIRYLYIDDCPVQFRKYKKTNTCYSAEEWCSMYGKYVIAENQDHAVMFACSYADTVWDFLLQRCGDTAEKIYTEKEWTDYKQKQIELEKKTENDNGYQEVVSGYDGYIN